jgi:hypothetical protein
VTTGTLAWRWNNYQVVDVGAATIGFDFSDVKDIKITVGNTYPGWTGTIWLEEANTGTLPLAFDSFQFTCDGSGWGNYYTIEFFAPGGSVNAGPWTLQYLHGYGPVTYASMGIPKEYVTIPVGGTQWSKIRLTLLDSAPKLYNSAFTFTFTHTAVVALP